MTLRVLVCSLLVAAMFVPTPAAAQCDDWQWVYPVPQGHTLNGTAFGGGRFVAVGEAGTVVFSDDGADWSVAIPGGGDTLHGVAWGMGLFVAVGENGRVLVSDNGQMWSPVVQATTQPLYAVASNGATFVAVGASGTALRSVDGYVWQRVDLGTERTLRVVACDGERFLVLDSAGKSARSDDGLQWSFGSGGPGSVRGLGWTGSRWVAVGILGSMAVSEDGFDWQDATPQTVLSMLNDVVSAEGVAVVVGASVVLASGDGGVTWEVAARTEVTTEGLQGAAWGNGRFVAVGVVGALASSEDGRQWQPRRQGRPVWINDMAWTANGLVAVGGNPYFESAVAGIVNADEDGGVLDIEPPIARTLNGVAVGPERIVAVGDHGTVLSSVDGVAWQPHDPRLAFGNELVAVEWTGDQFVAVGGMGAITTSADGTNWQSSPSVTINSLRGVATDGTVLVAVGENGTVLASRNAVAWERLSAGSAAILNDVVWTGRRFVAVGSLGTVVTSSDGLSWSVVDTPTRQNLFSVSAAGGELIAVGRFGTVIVSVDGHGWAWERLPSPSPRTLNAVAQGASRTYIGGRYGAILSRTCTRVLGSELVTESSR